MSRTLQIQACALVAFLLGGQVSQACGVDDKSQECQDERARISFFHSLSGDKEEAMIQKSKDAARHREKMRIHQEEHHD